MGSPQESERKGWGDGGRVWVLLFPLWSHTATKTDEEYFLTSQIETILESYKYLEFRERR